LREHLLADKVTCVVMEATGAYWKPFYYLLDDGLDVVLVNARDARNVPGRKSDVSDAIYNAEDIDKAQVKVVAINGAMIRTCG
jgi:transposase